jgi:hypothetical protein
MTRNQGAEESAAMTTREPVGRPTSMNEAPGLVKISHARRATGDAAGMSDPPVHGPSG